MPEGWLPASLNAGWVYRDRIPPAAAGMGVLTYYLSRHGHSSEATWRRRLQAGEIHRNGEPLRADAALAVGDRLAWHRPPWQEPAVPACWGVIHDDGDLLVIDKPSGLPVLPAGGFLEHTLLRLLERRHGADPAAVPRPVHRLGRFTSGLLVCARRPATRAWLSQRLREGSALPSWPPGPPEAAPCRKVYRALLAPGALDREVGDPLPITAPIGRQDHPLLGRIWCADPDGLVARSTLTLLEKRGEGDLVEVAIATGRPHQIRIHCAAIGAPLLGDPLYGPGGGARPDGLPGDGGYRLHAHHLAVGGAEGDRFAWETRMPAWAAGQTRSKTIRREK